MSENTKPTDLKFTYRKGNFYRMAHIDGALGGISPNSRYITMSLWSERRTIPKEQVYDLQADGKLAEDPKWEDDIGGVLREIELCAVLDIHVARALRKWLDQHIEMHEKVLKDIIANAAAKANK